ncbi:MAG: hypothetical protein RBQ95_04260 [Paracholeplasma sp.]|nr:hypothetical protein [Paracholeplasma sp.]MDY3196053.1 hypothetical protein [Paracholeplasma sp.]
MVSNYGRKELKYYTSRMLRIMKKSHSYEIVGEVGNMSRTDQFYTVKAVETGADIKVYPLGTHHFFFDRKVGYVLIGYDEAVIIYQKRFKSKKK